MSQPQICLHDLIDFILRTEKNWQWRHARKEKPINVNILKGKTGRTHHRQIIQCTTEDCFFALSARSDLCVSQKRGLSKAHLSPPRLQRSKHVRRSQHSLNFYSNNSVVKLEQRNWEGREKNCGDQVCVWLRPRMNKSHDPERNINHSCYHLVCRRVSTWVIRTDGWNLNGIIFERTVILFHFNN